MADALAQTALVENLTIVLADWGNALSSELQRVRLDLATISAQSGCAASCVSLASTISPQLYMNVGYYQVLMECMVRKRCMKIVGKA